MSARVLKYTVVVRNPDTLTAVALTAGQPVPDWADDLVHTDDLVTRDKFDAPAGGASEDSGDDASDPTGSEGSDGPKDYKSLTKAKLQAEVDARNEDRDDDDLIEVEAPGNKAELIAALQADDVAQAAAADEA